MSSKTNSNTSQIDCGSRAISRQNCSKIICLPRKALKGCGLKDSKRAQVILVITDKERFIKISVCNNELEADLKYTSNQHDFLTFNSSEKPQRYNNHYGDNNKND
jgi:hypothetical protein